MLQCRAWFFSPKTATRDRQLGGQALTKSVKVGIERPQGAKPVHLYALGMQSTQSVNHDKADLGRGMSK